ncbi:TRAFs-binding domain-containing protein [Halarcobacter sp.]|uniref:TRAFs-binding domain-containing protein n=1 Tax=Halarcobacter sp. TaxID=2321133 RepID=UPI003A914C42
MKPLCFILMPFGKKKDQTALEIDFDKIYEDFIKPSIEDAGLEPIRADEEQIGGIIHKPMYERLMLCEYAVADLSILNANVFYELGIRHAIRPHSTITLFENKSSLPFDISFLRSIPYDRNLSKLEELKSKLTNALLKVKKEKDVDSPLFQLVDGVKPSNIEHIKTDIFREQVEYNQTLKKKLENIRTSKSLDELITFENELDFEVVELGVIIDLFLSYRALESFENMVSFVDKIPKPLRQSIMIQEQLGFALNRVGRKDDAIKVLESIINEYGKSSETNGILGRVYKDKYTDALKEGNTIMAEGYLKKAIDTYLDGFEADFRDAYPGINAVTLMEIADDERKNEILPVVEFAVKQKMKTNKDYWDWATLLELAILETNKEKANQLLFNVLDNIRESFEPKTTVNNLNIIIESRKVKGVDTSWILDIVKNIQKEY